nr:protein dead ringer homolog [Dermatophagoides farinae]
MNRLSKSDDLNVAEQATELLSRHFKQQQQQRNRQQQQQQHLNSDNDDNNDGDDDDDDDDDEKPSSQRETDDTSTLMDDIDMNSFKSEHHQRELMLVAMQRQAAQMAAAAAAAGLPTAAHFANLAASVGNLAASSGGFNTNSFGHQLNAAFMNNHHHHPHHNHHSSASPSQTSGSSNHSTTSPSASASMHIQSIEPGKGYTYEEQFKQLYELSDEPKRKAFLDDLFSFMQKRGTPINRIPIMAKQVLDLYELYQLVVARGGLVEVINKKIWREITKGLSLPSSITSAAFTLRTQYMKYLYPYECEKEKLSQPEELQMAIDGNRREGRRSSYGQYPDLTNSPPPQPLQSSSSSSLQPPTSAQQYLNRNSLFVNSGSTNNNGHSSSPLSLVSRHILNGHHHNHHHRSSSQGHSSGEEDNASVSSNHTPYSHSLPGSGSSHHHHHQHNRLNPNEALNLEITPRNSSATNMAGSGNYNETTMTTSSTSAKLGSLDRKTNYEDLFGVTPNKRFHSDENFLLNACNFPSTHLKISSKDGRTLDGQLTVSMEINGILYHGILFAQTNNTNNRNNSGNK